MRKSTSSNSPSAVGGGSDNASISCDENLFMCSRLSQSRDALRSRELMFSLRLPLLPVRQSSSRPLLSQGCSLLSCSPLERPGAAPTPRCCVKMYSGELFSNTEGDARAKTPRRARIRRYTSMSLLRLCWAAQIRSGLTGAGAGSRVDLWTQTLGGHAFGRGQRAQGGARV